VATTLTEAQEQILGLVRESQQAVVKAVSSWTEQTSKLIPDVSGLPFAELYGKPSEVIDRNFDLAERLLASQRQFVKELLEASTVEPAADTKPSASKSSK
jgi:hypothetical protein